MEGPGLTGFNCFFLITKKKNFELAEQVNVT